jgi:hypothetical protein
MMIRIRKKKRLAVGMAAAALMVVTVSGSVHAALQQGGGGKDVIVGADDDNAANERVQPAGVQAKQHLDNTDLLIGGAKDDLLIGRLGDDVLDGQSGVDILVGGPEAGTAPNPNSDVILGGAHGDINIWAPGDGSDAFAGGKGRDVQILAPFVLDDDGELVLERFRGRTIPQVNIEGLPQFTCTIESARGAVRGYDYLVRFFANDNLAVTIRLRDVETVLCPGENADTVQRARLDRGSTDFVEVPANRFKSILRAIMGN